MYVGYRVAKSKNGYHVLIYYYRLDGWLYFSGILKNGREFLSIGLARRYAEKYFHHFMSQNKNYIFVGEMQPCLGRLSRSTLEQYATLCNNRIARTS